MAEMTFKSQQLIESHGTTPYRVAKTSPDKERTLYRWANKDATQGEFDTILIFLRGLGYSDEQIKALPLGEVFEIN